MTNFQDDRCAACGTEPSGCRAYGEHGTLPCCAGCSHIDADELPPMPPDPDTDDVPFALRRLKGTEVNLTDDDGERMPGGLLLVPQVFAHARRLRKGYGR